MSLIRPLLALVRNGGSVIITLSAKFTLDLVINNSTRSMWSTYWERSLYLFLSVPGEVDKLLCQRNADLPPGHESPRFGTRQDNKSKIEPFFSSELGLRSIPGRGYKCLLCATTFTSTSSARRHVIEAHKPRQKVYCNICLTVLSNSRSGREHMRNKHGITSKMAEKQLRPS